MIDCPRCGASFPDFPDTCPHCDAKEAARPAGDQDTQKLVFIREVDDPLLMERATAKLESEGIPVYARPRYAVEGMATSPTWWEILAAENEAERAGRLLEELVTSIESDAEEAGRAAEEEEAEWERTHPAARTGSDD